MSKTISNLKSDISRKIHGTDIDKLTDFYGLVYEAAGELLSEIDPEETIRISQITNSLYDQIYRYPAPADLKGNKIIDLRPQTDRSLKDSPGQVFLKDFDLRKDGRSRPVFTIEMESGDKTLKIDNPLLDTGVLVHACNNINDNGTWAAGGDASNLTQDTLYYLTGNGSLNFDISGISGYLEISDMAEVDLTDEEDVASFFLWLYIPDKTAFTSVDLRWGNDSSNYWNVTATAPHNEDIKDGWNLFRFDWNGATETGSPDSETVDYLRMTLTATTDTDYRLENIMCKTGSIYDLVYYSKYLFQNEAGTWQEKPLLDSDVINLDTDSYNLLTYKVMILAGQELAGSDSAFDVGIYTNLYKNKKSDYVADHPSQAIRTQSTYYRL